MTYILRRHILPVLLAAVAVATCGCSDSDREDITAPYVEAGGVDLSFGIGSSAFSNATIIGGSGTRTTWTDWDALAKDDEIQSLVMFVYHHTDNPAESRIAGYRLLIKPHDGTRYLAYNKNGILNPNTGLLWPNIELASVGGFHADGSDDRQADPETHGYNNWTDKPGNCQAKFDFMYLKPMHGMAERALAGKYKVAIIVNFNEAMPLIDVPYPDATQAPLVKGDVTVPVMEHPGFPIGYHVREILSYWQRHYLDPNFDGIPMDPCVDKGPWPENNGPKDQNDNACDWFIGARSLIYGRLFLNDASMESTSEYDSDGLRVPKSSDSVRSACYVNSKTAERVMTAMEEYTATAGQNSYNIDVERISARTTFHIHNQSTKPVTITNFSLSDNYAQAAVYLFWNSDNWGVQSTYSDRWRGAVDVTSDRTLIPFDNTITYEGGAYEMFFDALTFEASDDVNPMSFNISLKMDDIEGAEEVKTISATDVTYSDMQEALASEEWAVGERRRFLMQNMRDSSDAKYAKHKNKRMFLQSNDENSPTANVDFTDISHFTVHSLNEGMQFIWEIEKASATTVHIRSYDTRLYLKTPSTYNNSSGTKWFFTSNREEAAEFGLFYDGASGGMAFEYTYASDKYIYPHVVVWDYGSGSTMINAGECVAIGKWNDGGSHFKLYPITMGPSFSGSVTKNLNIPIWRVHPVTAHGEIMYSYKRNEHIHVLLNVQYVPHAKTIKFGVESWAEAPQEITFE